MAKIYEITKLEWKPNLHGESIEDAVDIYCYVGAYRQITYEIFPFDAVYRCCCDTRKTGTREEFFAKDFESAKLACQMHYDSLIISRIKGRVKSTKFI